MKKKIPVIFLLLCLVLYCIYQKFDISNVNVLYLGDDFIYYEIEELNQKYNLNKYTFDSITYKQIEEKIRKNSNKIIKDNEVYLNQLIASADAIVVSANNFKYNNKCKKIDRIIEEYDITIKNELKSLINVINKMSTAKIYVIGNHCNNKQYSQNIFLNEILYIDYKNISNINEIIEKTIHI